MNRDNFLDDDRPLSPTDAAAAILVAPDGRYLLQLRDDKPGIFYPAHWGFFGGAIEDSDPSIEEGLRRELVEEIGVALEPGALVRFTTTSFDLAFARMGIVNRSYWEAPLDRAQIDGIHLAEGSRFALFSARDALATLRLTPYDGFALWMHANRRRMRPPTP